MTTTYIKIALKTILFTASFFAYMGIMIVGYMATI